MIKLTTEEFIKRCKEKYGDKYDYSKTIYNGMDKKIIVICPIHGEFKVSASNHLYGKTGCRRCGISKRANEISFSYSEFIKRCKEKYGDKYDYSKVEYKGHREKVCIICPTHGEFWQSPSNHLRGCGCPKCGIEISSDKRMHTKKEFVEKAQEIHNNKYDYSKVVYKGVKEKVCIICPTHGEFWQSPSKHLNNSGCPKCGNLSKKIKQIKSKETFIQEANKVHENKYDYSKLEYKGDREKVCIICPTHGEFCQTPHDHLDYHGCPICSNSISKKEKELITFIQEIGIKNIEERNRTLLNGKEIDIYLPDYKIGIEYNGVHWHSEQFNKDKWYHLTKTKECKKQNVRLIHIFEDEYIDNKEIVLHKLKHILKKDENIKKIGARKCIIKEINCKICKEFMDKYHIQGFAKSSIYLGCFYEGSMIASMTFKKRSENEWELNRFSSNFNYLIQGGGGKMLKYFIKHYTPKEIISFGDLRWVDKDSNIYNELGFKLDKILPPDYSYVKDSGFKRIHKFNLRKSKINKKYGLPLTMTENEMASKLHFYKIWNCGLLRYKWESNNEETIN